MNVVKDMALKATRFAKKETKLALLSLALLSLASCTSDPKVLEQEAKLAQSQKEETRAARRATKSL